MRNYYTPGAGARVYAYCYLQSNIWNVIKIIIIIVIITINIKMTYRTLNIIAITAGLFFVIIWGNSLLFIAEGLGYKTGIAICYPRLWITAGSSAVASAFLPASSPAVRSAWPTRYSTRCRRARGQQLDRRKLCTDRQQQIDYAE